MINELTEQTILSLEELAQAVTKILVEQGLIQSDHRVSAVPDARTIRYYTTLGLLDRPLVVGRQARYGRRHVLQLLAVKSLQALAIPLAEIQSRLYGRSDQELNALLTAIATQQQQRRLPAIPIISWREITIEPGLKILAQADWSSSLTQTALIEKLTAALAALNNQANEGEK